MNLLQAFDNDFSAERTNLFSKQIFLGTEAFNKFFLENKKFFSYPEYSSLKGHLLNYSVQKLLYDSAFTPSAPYQAIPIRVNKFGYSVLHIKTENFQTTTAKTNKWTNLPSCSGYKCEYAKANADGDGQLYFDFEQKTCRNAPYYALLTYGYNTRTQECSHIDLIIPDDKFKNILHRKNLLSNFHNELYLLPSESEIEETVAVLNPEFEKIIQLKDIRKGV